MLTLKDPISMTRIDLPCKSRYCQHTACFDAATFLTPVQFAWPVKLFHKTRRMDLHCICLVLAFVCGQEVLHGVSICFADEGFMAAVTQVAHGLTRY